MRIFDADQGEPGYWPSPDSSETLVASADRRYFFFLTHRGELSGDAVAYELEVFDVGAIRKRLRSTERNAPVAAR
jgi:hypothetical protein